MCRITNPNPRIIAYCDKPYKLMYVTITFRSFTPQPGGLEFQPGQDYYFICKYPYIHTYIRVYLYIYISSILYAHIKYVPVATAAPSCRIVTSDYNNNNNNIFVIILRVGTKALRTMIEFHFRNVSVKVFIPFFSSSSIHCVTACT